MALLKFSTKYAAFERAARALGIDKEPRPVYERHDDDYWATHDRSTRPTRGFQPFRGYENGDGTYSIWIEKDVGYGGIAARMGYPELDAAAAEHLVRPKIEGAFRLRNAKFEGLS